MSHLPFLYVLPLRCPTPYILTELQSTGKFEDEDVNRPHATEELAAYLWDNYIEYEFSPKARRIRH
jgi:hypothetical protein